MRVIVFLWHVFSLFFFSHRLGIRVNSLQNLLVNRVHLQKQRALVKYILLLVLILDTFLSKCNLNSHPKHTWPKI